ncbi:hypothetical protein [Streptomyces liangshanensis]|uniref:hypothetical protein n=1 Tax=Streptomyces liangshanensis TaxID=2717324 RepID=UPI0036DF2673
MSVEIKFIDKTRASEDPYRHEDGEGREYRYVVQDNGTLAIFEKEESGYIQGNADPIAVYGAAAWFSVTGDPKTKKDSPPARMRTL